MTVDITTKLAAIRSIVDDIAVHLATTGATSPIAPKPTPLFGDRLDALDRRIDDLSRRIHDLANTLDTLDTAHLTIDRRTTDLADLINRAAMRINENDAHIEHIEGRLDAMEAAWQDHVTPPGKLPMPPDPVDKDTPF